LFVSEDNIYFELNGISNTFIPSDFSSVRVSVLIFYIWKTIFQQRQWKCRPSLCGGPVLGPVDRDNSACGSKCPKKLETKH